MRRNSAGLCLASPVFQPCGTWGGVSLVSLDAETAFLAGALRAQYGLPLPDMFQVAVAMRQAAPAILTQDARIKVVEDLAVYTLDDIAG